MTRSAGFVPMPLRRVLEPFDDRGWLFELKLDGFRALAHVDGSGARLFSRISYRSDRASRQPGRGVGYMLVPEGLDAGPLGNRSRLRLCSPLPFELKEHLGAEAVAMRHAVGAECRAVVFLCNRQSAALHRRARCLERAGIVHTIEAEQRPSGTYYKLCVRPDDAVAAHLALQMGGCYRSSRLQGARPATLMMTLRDLPRTLWDGVLLLCGRLANLVWRTGPPLVGSSASQQFDPPVAAEAELLRMRPRSAFPIEAPDSSASAEDAIPLIPLIPAPTPVSSGASHGTDGTREIGAPEFGFTGSPQRVLAGERPGEREAHPSE